ncbi:hypothetical protein VMCG_05614 [Cytospora schulzeri]|uniref:Fungal N-terminal domain-containing protein n=1 Tax=Cytospora schulzeri TaxID=448051 RepID=A0A423WF91_9PEZI|nr:hypothetical protein VMCG_05614 [Valsa malicola]
MAAPGFGFSVGDFISGISLVKKLIRALNDTAGSRASYRQLISELLNLDEALGLVKDLPTNPGQEAQKATLQQIAGKCQLSIESFLNKNSKFKESLGLQPSASTWKSNLHKIQWALCKDDAVDALRTKIAAYTLSLNLILANMQLVKSYVVI